MGRHFLKIFRLWKVYGTLDFIFLIRDFKSVLFYFVSDVIINLAGITGVYLLAERFNGIGDWSKTEIIFMLGYAALIKGLCDAFFNYNVLHVSRRIGRGQLDHTLVQPQPLWLSLLTEGFAPFSGMGGLASGLLVFVWGFSKLNIAVDVLWFLQLILYIFCSVAIFMSYSFLWSSLAFWAPRSAEEISTSAVRVLNQLKSYPLDGIGGLWSWGLFTVVPASYLAWLPCYYLMQNDSTTELKWIMPLACLTFMLAALALFTKGLRYYGTTGSQRYSVFGHRR